MLEFGELHYIALRIVDKEHLYDIRVPTILKLTVLLV